MSYSFRCFIEENYFDVLKNAVDRFIREDDTDDCTVRVKSVIIDDIDYSSLKNAQDHVKFKIILKAHIESTDGISAYHNDLYLFGTLSGSFSADFNDIQIKYIKRIERFHKRFPVKYTDDLVKVLDKNHIEQDAADFIGMSHPLNETMPCVISPEYLAGQMKIPVMYIALRPDMSVRGEYVYKDCYRMEYDEKTKTYRSIWVKKGTILIEKNLRSKPEICRFTLMHELDHAVNNRFAFELIRMCDPDATFMMCQVDNSGKSCSEDSFIERIERHADMFASAALMPERQFRLVAERLKPKKVTADTIYEQLEKTACFFKVTIAACKRRYLMLGYEQMRGMHTSNGANYGRNQHYNESRYRMLNYHSVFTKGTVEFRLFQFDKPTAEKKNGLHAGQLKSYIQLCLALSEMAKDLRTASPKPQQTENPKFAMRTWLIRLGLVGEEFSTARDFLTRNLSGNAAWRFGN